MGKENKVIWQDFQVTKVDRSVHKGHAAKCYWLTGLSGSGKSTLANSFEVALLQRGYHTYVLDGDNVRHGLNRDLGFAEEDRVENIRRVAEVARLMVDAGLVVIVSFISPFKNDRLLARKLFGYGEFLEVFIDAPLEICEQRDPKGLYVKARRGQIKNFTGLDSPYEAPTNPDIHLKTDVQNVQSLVDKLMETL